MANRPRASPEGTLTGSFVEAGIGVSESRFLAPSVAEDGSAAGSSLGFSFVLGAASVFAVSGGFCGGSASLAAGSGEGSGGGGRAGAFIRLGNSIFSGRSEGLASMSGGLLGGRTSFGFSRRIFGASLSAGRTIAGSGALGSGGVSGTGSGLGSLGGSGAGSGIFGATGAASATCTIFGSGIGGIRTGGFTISGCRTVWMRFVGFGGSEIIVCGPG